MRQTRDSQPANPDRDRLLRDLKALVRKTHTCIADGRWEKAEELCEQMELLVDRLREMRSDFSPIILDAVNAQAKLSIYSGKIELAEIHLSFVSDVCLGRPSGEFTPQFADCLECYSRVAMARRDWESFEISLEKCAEIRRNVLGPNHVDTLRAQREWETFLDILTDPALE
jgi:hypothetical protein